MPRFFFHVVNSSRAEDPIGVVLPDLETARHEALKDIEDLKRQNFATLDTSQWTGWHLEVCDEKGAVLLVVPFATH